MFTLYDLLGPWLMLVIVYAFKLHGRCLKPAIFFFAVVNSYGKVEAAMVYSSPFSCLCFAWS